MKLGSEAENSCDWNCRIIITCNITTCCFVSGVFLEAVLEGASHPAGVELWPRRYLAALLPERHPCGGVHARGLHCGRHRYTHCGHMWYNIRISPSLSELKCNKFILILSSGLKMLTNQKRGDYYGIVSTWPAKRQRELGVHLLYKAMQIFLAEGERQLRPADIRRWCHVVCTTLSIREHFGLNHAVRSGMLSALRWFYSTSH